MESRQNTILRFEEFIAQNSKTEQPSHQMDTQDQMDSPEMGTEPNISFDDSDEPVPPTEPIPGETEHNVPLNMIDDETGEAEAQAPVVDDVEFTNGPKND